MPSRAGRRWVLIALAVAVGCVALLGGWFLFLAPMDSEEYEQGATDAMLDSAMLVGTFFDEMDESEPDSDELTDPDIAALQEITGRYSADMEEIRKAAHRLRPPQRYEATQERLERVVDFLADDLFGLFDRAMRDMEPGESFSDINSKFLREVRDVAMRAGRAQSDLIEIAEKLGIEEDIGEIVEITAALSASSDSSGESDDNTY